MLALLFYRLYLMRPFRRYTDPGLLVAFALATLAVWPLITRPSLPTLTDAEMHVYRAAEVADSISRGAFYPRWAADFYFGYGYPVFNFYSPFTYHLAAYYGLLTGLGPVAGTKLVLVLAVYIGAGGMYLFGRDRWGGIVGVVSAAAFTFSPYMVYIDPHARGDIPENFAINLAPLMLWTFDRLRRTGSLRHLALCGVLLAALILSHPLMALVVYTMLLAFLVWETVISPLVPQTYLGPHPRQFIPQLAAAIGLGLGLAAVYWLPAGLDRSAIQLRNVAGPGYFDFHNFFVSLRELSSPTGYFDLGATEPRFYYNLGLAQIVLAAIGALTVFSERLRRTDTFFFLFASVAWVYLITPASVNFWEAVPLMVFFQFPTRFLGPAALVFAPLAGNAVRWAERFDLPDGRILIASSAVCLAAILYSAIPLLYLPEWNEFGKVDALRMISVELQGRALGTTSANDFLPVDVALVPGPQESVLDSYEAGGPVDRVNRATLPAGATVELLEQKPFYDRYEVNSSTDFVFRVFLFYFPGWTARVDGVEANIDVAQPDGLITVHVPTGKHIVEISFEETLQRSIAWVISMAALIGLAAVIVAAVRRRDDPLGVFPLPWKTGAVLGAVVVAGLGLKLIADQTGAFRYHSSGNSVLIAQYLYYVKLEREVQLLGY
ncbi:MAG TPA: 6-pyruvoyl-tetrahydropterin synthase-related protein, partial [Anaerolineales bacterium]|nr:6-pyruvoyl-tetrahydropterin synthase-related protein [Anaerolineales bacterium]